MDSNYSGSCLCGKIRYEFGKFKTNPNHCHCSMCRKFHGAAYGTYGMVGLKDFAWTEGEEFLKKYQSSSDVERGFCSVCGSSLYYRRTTQEKYIDIAIGTLDQDLKTENLPTQHIFVQNKPNWYQIDDKLEKYSGFPERKT